MDRTAGLARKWSPFEVTNRIRAVYEADLRKIAREIGRIVNGTSAGAVPDLTSDGRIVRALRAYALDITPWATRRATAAVERMEAMNRRAWRLHAQNLSKGVRAELERAPIRDVMERYIREQAAFIRELPLDAVDRIETLHAEVLTGGRRAEDIAAELQRQGKVSAYRATLIARTETARTSNALTRARAEYVGADSHVWRTARDGDVRPSHRGMEGKVVAYAAPPVLDGKAAHAGEIYNCRCYQEPIIPDRYVPAWGKE